MFSYEYCKIYKNRIFYGTPLIAASVDVTLFTVIEIINIIFVVDEKKTVSLNNILAQSNLIRRTKITYAVST